jgi:prepilin-type N-terminal cleavage/methylation domain-containing protein
MNLQQNTKYDIRTTHGEKGFTLIELVVAITLMAVVIAFAGTVFKSSITSYRIAAAQAEIMQKFRAITDQLNNDFRGLRKDAPLFIWFELDPNDSNKRLDQIMFFADGDFQSIQTYAFNGTEIVPASSGSPVVSNLARIYYGHAWSIDPNNYLNDPRNIQPNNRLLSRRQHLLIANPDTPPQYAQFPTHDPTFKTMIINAADNNSYEHDTNSLSQWQAGVQNSTSVDNIITGCFGSVASDFSNNRPHIDTADSNTIHNLMVEGIGSFSIQWAYYQIPHYGYFWWPGIDPDGNDIFTDSDFGASGINLSQFGFYFNTVASSFATSWFTDSYSGTMGKYYLEKPAFPQAMKFTFTIYDSRGVFRDGQTFTHIVYLGD